MSDTQTYSSDVAFSPAVKLIQARKGSRDAYAHVEARGGWRTEIDDNLAAFLANAESLYFATASADGQPTIQHRGGPKGFVKVLDSNTMPLPITAATGNTSPRATCRKTRRLTSS
jgi:hypothetical protein